MSALTSSRVVASKCIMGFQATDCHPWQVQTALTCFIHEELKGIFSSVNYNNVSLRKQPTFGDATTGFLTKWRLRNERWNSILMMCHYPDLGSASDWSCRIANLFQPTRVISMEFLRLFLRRHLVGKPVTASPNDGCRFSQANYQHLVVVFTAALYPTIAIHSLQLTHFTNNYYT